MATPRSLRDQLIDAYTHCGGHPGRAGRSIVTWDGIVKEGHHAVSGIAVKRTLKLMHKETEHTVELTEQTHHSFRLDRFRERREPSQVAEHDSDLAPVALKERFVA